MEKNCISKEIIDNIPPNLFSHSITKRKMKIFFHDFHKIINEKSNRKENFQNIKKDLFLLQKKYFPDIYQHFYAGNNFENLEIYIFCLCNQIENQISKIVSGYQSFDLILNELELNIMINNKNKGKNTILSFLISFYDFFEDELVINNDDIMNSVIEINNKSTTQQKSNDEKLKKEKDEINNSFLLSLFKIINLINNLYIGKNEFNNIFSVGMNGPNSNYFSLNDMGFLLIKILEALIKIKNFIINKKKDIDKNLFRFVEISYFNIIPSLSEFFANIILNYNLKHTFNIIIKKEEFLTLFSEISSIKIIRQKLLTTLSMLDKIFKPDKEAFCKKFLSKQKIIDKIIRHISNDINKKRYYNAKDILSELRLLIIYYINNNIPYTKFEENIIPLFKNISDNYSKTDTNYNKSFYEFIEEINTFSYSLQDENKFKIYNMMISLFQISPMLTKSIVPIFLHNFKDKIDIYQDMIGKTNFFNSFINNLYRYEPEVIKYFFMLLINLYNNFQYLPNVELSKLINSISLFTEVANIKQLVNGLKEFNNLVNQKKKSYILLNQINQNVSKNQKSKKNNIINSCELEENESIDLFEEFNKSYIDIINNLINDVISQIKQNKTQNLFKPELLYFLFDYIQEIIKEESIYKYFSDKNFPSLFHSIVSIPKYKPVAYKIIEVFLKSSIDKENNEAFIKFILNRYTYFSVEGVEEKDEKKILFVEMNKIKELILMYRTLKITFVTETLNEKSAIQNKLNEKIVEFILTYVDYINEIKTNIYKIYNYQFHYYLKEYLELLFELILISNKNVINKQNEFSPKLSCENLERIIEKTLLFFKGYPNKETKKDDINVNLNKSLSNNIKNEEKNDNQIKQKNNINQSYNDNINNIPLYNDKSRDDLNINNDKNNNIKSKIKNIERNNNDIDYSLDIIKYFIDKSLNIA